MSTRDIALGEPLGALSRRERHILSQVLDGSSSKSIALAVGVSETLVSKILAASALKLGFRNRAALVHFAALSCSRAEPAASSPGSPVQTSLPGDLTPAERGVLALVVAGHSNEEIAALRRRSQRTVANQVSALLRKTGLGSRRCLIVAFCNVAHESCA